MKVIAKPVEMIAYYQKNGIPIPLRFRLEQKDGSFLTIKVGHIASRTEEKLAGNLMYVYRCQSVIQQSERVYEIKYEIGTCLWYLYKI